MGTLWGKWRFLLPTLFVLSANLAHAGVGSICKKISASFSLSEQRKNLRIFEDPVESDLGIINWFGRQNSIDGGALSEGFLLSEITLRAQHYASELSKIQALLHTAPRNTRLTLLRFPRQLRRFHQWALSHDIELDQSFTEVAQSVRRAEQEHFLPSMIEQIGADLEAATDSLQWGDYVSLELPHADARKIIENSIEDFLSILASFEDFSPKQQLQFFVLLEELMDASGYLEGARHGAGLGTQPSRSVAELDAFHEKKHGYISLHLDRVLESGVSNAERAELSFLVNHLDSMNSGQKQKLKLWLSEEVQAREKGELSRSEKKRLEFLFAGWRSFHTRRIQKIWDWTGKSGSKFHSLSDAQDKLLIEKLKANKGKKKDHGFDQSDFFEARDSLLELLSLVPDIQVGSVAHLAITESLPFLREQKISVVMTDGRFLNAEEIQDEVIGSHLDFLRSAREEELSIAQSIEYLEESVRPVRGFFKIRKAHKLRLRLDQLKSSVEAVVRNVDLDAPAPAYLELLEYWSDEFMKNDVPGPRELLESHGLL